MAKPLQQNGGKAHEDWRFLPAQVEDKPVLRHLLQLCLHDYSEFNGKEVNDCGLFDYPLPDLLLDGRLGDIQFFGCDVEGKLAGFVLVRQLEAEKDEPLWQMAEFFILRKYRRQGIGREVAHRVFDQFEGRWQVIPRERAICLLSGSGNG